MLEDYKNALKSGQRAYRACVARGQSPYLAVLDDILVNVNIVAQEPLGLVEIPAESIVGTKTSGRHTAFAPNFMPLLEPDTEFAGKWSNLCDAHLDEGIHTPIIAYEFLNKFYVQEGNKRVSVLKYFDAVRIAGTVTRLIPERNDSLENRIYYEFLDFYKLSKVNDVHFSRLGGYAKLQTLVCKASGESWTDDDRLSFSSFYTMFRQQFLALGGGGLNLTAGDAMLVYLSVYRYADACESTPSQMKQNLEKLWDEVKVLTEPQAVALSLEPKQGPGEPLLAKLNIFTKPSELKVVFLHEHNAENSAFFCPFVFFCTQVLTDKGSKRQGKTGNRKKSKAFNLAVRAAACHCHLSKFINVGLHYHVCQRNNGILQTCRKTIGNNLFQH